MPVKSKSKQKTISIPRRIIRTQGVVIIHIEEFDQLREDLEMLSSQELPKEIAKAREEIRQVETYSLEEVEQPTSV